MKRWRRIEITTFRRRTTVILCDRPTDAAFEPPPHQADAPHAVAAGSPQAEESELNQSQTKQLPPGSLDLTGLEK